MYPDFKEEHSRLWLKFWRCSCTFEHRNVYATGEILIGVQKYLMIFVYHPFPAERRGSSVVSQIKSESLLFVNVAVTQEILHQSWLICCRRLQKGAFLPAWQCTCCGRSDASRCPAGNPRCSREAATRWPEGRGVTALPWIWMLCVCWSSILYQCLLFACLFFLN